LYTGKKFKFGSLDESLAIIEFNRERNRNFLAALFSAVGPDQANKLLKDYRGAMYPEEKFDDISHIHKAKETFKKMQNVVIKAMNAGT